MRKIPIGETISGAYSFAFAGFLSVLGIAWFPHLVLLAFAGALIYGLDPGLPGEVLRGEFNPGMLFSVLRIYGLLSLATMLVQAIVTVGLQKKALGKLEGPTFFYFTLGTPVWLLLATYILSVVAIIFVFVLTAGVVAAIAVAASHYVAQFGNAIAAVAIIAGVCWYIYFVVRLTFFLPSVVVAEEQIGLVRAWELGAGNFWRIVLVFIVVFLPVSIGFGMIRNAVLAPLVIPGDLAGRFHPGMSMDDIMHTYAGFGKAFMQDLYRAGPFVLVLAVIESIVFLGLGNGAVAAAYRGVTGKSGAE